MTVPPPDEAPRDKRAVHRQTARVLPVDPEGRVLGLDQWEQATTDKYGWLTAADLGADEPPAHPDIPELMRVAAASVRRE